MLFVILLPATDISAANSLTENNRKVLILGDSLSAGYGIEQGYNWTDLLQEKFSSENKDIEIINASISGDTTANGLQRLPAALKLHHPEIVLLELGGNDGLRGLPIRLIKKNLELMILQSIAGDARVLLMEINIPPNYGRKYTQALQQIYTDLAEQYSLTLIPFILREIALNPEFMQTDGIHPNARAQDKIMAQIWKVLEAVL